ncbi:hypothetical protein J3A83DRAFT_4368055 [Scleroderma citrinum]
MPSITITDATPRKNTVPSLQLSTPSASSSSNSSYRLLYRGALSLPDSHILLDGLTFSACLPGNIRQLPYDSPSNLQSSDFLARDLIHNPLALALESMRGRPSLRLKGTIRLKDIWMDETGEIYMDIHPSATLSRVYIENTLCLSPLTSVPCEAGSTKRTEMGVRVALGDTDGLETTEVVIYGETTDTLHLPVIAPAVSSSTSPNTPLVIRVARITLAPRAPRPDDPTPRKPPAQPSGGSIVGELGARKRIGVCPMTMKHGSEAEDEDDNLVRRARKVMLHLPRSIAPPSSRSGRIAQRPKQKSKESGKDQPTLQGSSDFKVPDVPQKVRRIDVFGTIEHPPDVVNEVGGAGKWRGKERGLDAENEVEGSERLGSIEAANKLVVKRLAVRRLAQAGIPRTHPEFKELFGFIYRGAAFALVS